MDTKLILISGAAILFGVLLMKKYKFYRHSSDDMSFTTELRVFIGGLLLFLIGVIGTLESLFHIFN